VCACVWACDWGSETCARHSLCRVLICGLTSTDVCCASSLP
jgi:hypothetical protein